MSDIAAAEHLAWCKRRALEYVDRGDLNNAVMSMISDLTKHPDFVGEVYTILSVIGAMEIKNGPEAVRRWINDSNWTERGESTMKPPARYTYWTPPDHSTLEVYDNKLKARVEFSRGARAILRRLDRLTQTAGTPEIDHYLRGLLDGARYG